MVIPPLAGLALIPAVLLALMLAVKAAQQRGLLDPELARKCVHTGMGLVAVSFPYLFHQVWPVLVLAGLSIGLLLVVKMPGPLRRQLGGVLDSVERQSYGEVYFPLAVAILFLASHERPILYIIPVLILAFGDAAAALIGVRYGQRKYAATDGSKSAEGSVTFFTVTFLAVHVPLLLLTNTGRAECLLIGLIMGLLVMELEAIAWDGLDNLFIPLGAYTLLHAFLPLSAEQLGVRLAVAAIWTIAVIAVRRYTTLNAGALLGIAVLGYICWAVGGLRWMVAPLTVLATYPLLSPRTAQSKHRSHSVHSVLSVGAVGFLWLFVAATWHVRGLLFPYTVSYAVQLAVILVARWRHWSDRAVGTGRIVLCGVSAWLLLALPYPFLERLPEHIPWKLAVMAALIAGSVILFCRFERGREAEPTDSRRLWRQAMLAGAASCVGAIGVL